MQWQPPSNVSQVSEMTTGNGSPKRKHLLALPQETGFRRRLGRTYNPNVPPRLSRRSRRRRWAGAATRQTDQEFRLGPGREIAWLPACNFVCKRNLVARIGTQVRMSLEVSKRRCHLSSTRKERCENFRRDLFEREFMSLPIQRVDDFVEAHKITDEGQILAVPCLIRVCEGTGHDVAEFSDVAHVDATHTRVDRKSPAHCPVFLPVRSQCAHKVLVEKWCDYERMIPKPGLLDDPVDVGLTGKVGNVELPAADRSDTRQRCPH